jgi:putative ABC transport system ATP-binding protein
VAPPSARIGPAVRARAVCKQFGSGPAAVHALNGVELEVPGGQFLTLMGPRSSGKSTFLHLIAGLDAPTSGWIEVGDVRIDTLDQNAAARFRRREIGIVFQFFNLVPSLSVAENVALPLILDGHPPAQTRARARDLLGSLGISALAANAPATLSGGEMQRVAIARALMAEPMLILADEPTGSLDSRTAEEVFSALRHACDERSVTVLLVTHDRRSATYSDRVVVMRDGKIEADLPNLQQDW